MYSSIFLEDVSHCRIHPRNAHNPPVLAYVRQYSTELPFPENGTGQQPGFW